MDISIQIYKNKRLHQSNLLVPYFDQMVYFWPAVEEDGEYSFAVTLQQAKTRVRNITYSHTIPFSNSFAAYTSESEAMKSISGFKKGEDIILSYNWFDHSFSIKRAHFTKFMINLTELGIEKADHVCMIGQFNDWNELSNPMQKKNANHWLTYLDLKDGIHGYQLLVDNKKVERETFKIITGETAHLFEKGKIGSRQFVYASLYPDREEKAIKHNPFQLEYLNKVSLNAVEFSIRCQAQDVERVNLILPREKDPSGSKNGAIYAMQRTYDEKLGFDYFKIIVNFQDKAEKLTYYFELIDQTYQAYLDNSGLNAEPDQPFEVDYQSGQYPFFHVPEWAKKAVWYCIFPDRFYNGNPDNDPIYNEWGPDVFCRNPAHKDLIPDYQWNATQTGLHFQVSPWTSDFESRRDWEIKAEEKLEHSVKYTRMYGGDLTGIKQKIPYLKKLGITALWLNPVFFASTNHKYNAADYRHISPDLGVIKMTGQTYAIEIAKNNAFGNKTYLDVLGREKAVGKSELSALKINLTGKDRGQNQFYETEDPSTWVWTESDLIMIDLIKTLHKNGIRIIFDGVFNHSGTSHWAFEAVLTQGPQSKYADWYKINDLTSIRCIEEHTSEEQAYRIFQDNKEKVAYSAWADYRGLPEFNSYNPDFQEHIFNITKKWLLGPDGVISENWQENDGIDGWRLDVPECIENPDFWPRWRKVVKSVQPQAYITAEIWTNASNEINEGKKYDSIMNYEWLTTVIAYFINQGQVPGKTYKLGASQFFNELARKRESYPIQSVQVAQNLNGSHDTDRLLSRIINDQLGNNLEEGKQIFKGYNSIRPDLATDQHPNTSRNWVKSIVKPKDILKLISLFQMTYIGAPLLYYGDEIGLWGATDPYSRKPMLWPEFTYQDESNGSQVNQKEKYSVQPDQELFDWYSRLIKIRQEYDTFVYGDFKPLLADDERDIIAYQRADKNHQFIVILNNSFTDHEHISVQTPNLTQKLSDLISGSQRQTNAEGIVSLDLEAKKGCLLQCV